MAKNGRRIIIVEDDYFLASDLANGFVEAGFEIVGPVPSLAMALALVEKEQVEGALLDINLDGEKVWDVADALIKRGIPVVFVTGYDRDHIPERYAEVPLCLKPVNAADVMTALARAT